MKWAINKGDNDRTKKKGLPPSHYPSRASLYRFSKQLLNNSVT